MNKKYLHYIEYPDKGHYISIGRNAPWNNRIQIRLPKNICIKLDGLL